MRHVDVDLTDRPDIADRFHVLQTPTTLILDARGVVRARIGGRAAARTTCAHRPRHPHRELTHDHVLNAAGIDPRGPRFAAAITAVLLLVDRRCLGLGGADARRAGVLLAVDRAPSSRGARSPASGATRSACVFRALVRPRLAPPDRARGPAPADLRAGRRLRRDGRRRDPRPARHRRRPSPIAAALAFVAAFLNAAFGYCLGCQIYLLLAAGPASIREAPDARGIRRG